MSLSFFFQVNKSEEQQQVLLTATYDHVESPASSPTSTTAGDNLADVVSPTKDDIDIDR